MLKNQKNYYFLKISNIHAQLIFRIFKIFFHAFSPRSQIHVEHFYFVIFFRYVNSKGKKYAYVTKIVRVDVIIIDIGFTSIYFPLLCGFLKYFIIINFESHVKYLWARNTEIQRNEIFSPFNVRLVWPNFLFITKILQKCKNNIVHTGSY